jgi:hypothetical protein
MEYLSTAFQDYAKLPEPPFGRAQGKIESGGPLDQTAIFTE